MLMLKKLRKLSTIYVIRKYSDSKNPLNKTLNVLAEGIPTVLRGKGTMTTYPEHADVVIIGGGIMGSSVAYWLKHRAAKGLSVVVLEKDKMYKQASTVLSVGGLRQQFSLPENVQLSQYCAEFLRDIKQHLGPEVDVQFAPHGYLVVATEKGAAELERSATMQKELGVKNELLSSEKLKQRFPWLNTSDIKLGCLGLESEGWMDPWSLLKGFTNKAAELGTNYVNAEVVGFEMEQQRDVLMEGVQPGSFQRITKVIYKTPDGEQHSVKFALCVLAAGPQSGDIAKMAGIGVGDGLLSIPLPIEPRKRNVYCFECRGDKPPGISTPMVMDITGTWVRRDGFGNNYIAGKAPKPEKDVRCTDASPEVDHQYFDEEIWPCLAHRIPAFENLKVKSSWAGWYEYNTFDENGIIGPHPYHNNLFIASGFSGHGLQHAPATGRAIAELIIDSGYTTIDLTRLGFDRLLTARPMFEMNIF